MMTLGTRLSCTAISLVAVIAFPAFGQFRLERIAAEFEQPLSCGHRIWNAQEIASFLEAAVSYAPHIAPNPRIAGTHGVIADRTRSGYYGGVYLGPIRVSDRELNYYQMTIWGDLQRGWRVKQNTSYRTISTDGHPTWLLLEDDNLLDDFEITEQHALTIISRVRELVEQEVQSTDGEPLVPLTMDQIDQLHRFESSYWTPPDIIFEDSEPPPWWAGHIVITAKSQQPGSHHNVYRGGVQFAATDEGLKFVRAIPAYDVFEYLGLQRMECRAYVRQ